MGKINLLSFEVANLIAAGEVVDRPASAVKELLENAIDSGAKHVTLEIQRGGITFIRVADDGCGIERDDLVPAITRHSTSKIKEARDLDSIMTLGFRGEALAAIASVSRLRIFSKTADDPMGALLQSEGGRVVSVTDTGCQDGTTVIVEDLFYNVPARRKFLKKDSTEATAIGAVIEKIAISRPDISFKFISDGEIKFLTSGSGDMKEAIWALFGKETARRSIRVDREENGIRVQGYISEPDIARSNRNMENFFINGRYIKSRTATAAIEQAYSSKIQHEKFPFCVLFIELNPAAVDVNVHPAKLEVKFANEKLIFDAVYYAVLSALEASAKRPELELSKPAQQNPYSGGITREQLLSTGVPLDTRHRRAEQVKMGERPKTTPVYRDTTPANITVNIPRGQEAINFGEAFAREIHSSTFEKTEVRKPEFVSEEPKEAPVFEKKPPITAELPDPYADYACPIDEDDIPDYHIIGEAWNCYVMVALSDRLLMIDKHAAHERIIFDELCRRLHSRMKDAQDSQVLLAPLECTVTTAELDSLTDYGEKIASLGFEYTSKKSGVSTHAVSITHIPASLERDSAMELFSTLVGRLSDASGSVESASIGFFETRLWQASCKAAIKGGRIYDQGHIKWICDRLLKKPDGENSVIRTCPHGRPVAFEIKKSSVDRQFSRLL